MGSIILLALGALVGYAYGTQQMPGKKALPPGVRIPRPATVVALPMDVSDFQEIDATICECFQFLANQAQQMVAQGQLPPPPGPDTPPQQAEPMRQAYFDAVITHLQQCVAVNFYPQTEVPWPPVPGDHPTIHQLWGMIGYRVRRLVLHGELDNMCPTGPPQQAGTAEAGP